MNHEKWKDVPGYEGYYQVSNLGQVRSLDRECGKMPRGCERRIKGQMLTPHDNGYGYLIVQLKKDGKRKPKYVHRLVAEMFVNNPKCSPVVDHVDGDRKNNRYDNLRWCTQMENVNFSMDKILKRPSVPTKSGHKHIQIVKDGRYLVAIKRKNTPNIYKRFKTLDDAVLFRDEVLNEYSIAIE